MTLADRMQQEDKAQHIICAFMVVLMLAQLTTILLAGTAVFVAGLLKEAWDATRGTGFCWYDVLANSLGIVFAASLLALLRL